jgi:hypothetical protein
MFEGVLQAAEGIGRPLGSEVFLNCLAGLTCASPGRARRAARGKSSIKASVTMA